MPTGDAPGRPGRESTDSRAGELSKAPAPRRKTAGPSSHPARRCGHGGEELLWPTGGASRPPQSHTSACTSRTPFSSRQVANCANRIGLPSASVRVVKMRAALPPVLSAAEIGHRRDNLALAQARVALARRRGDLGLCTPYTRQSQRAKGGLVAVCVLRASRVKLTALTQATNAAHHTPEDG